MPLNGKHVLITGSSRGIGRGIALKLAEHRAKLAIHYYQNEKIAKETLTRVRERGGEGFVVQADVSRPDEIKQLFTEVQTEFGTLDVFVSNARPELPTFYHSPMEITPKQWDMAFDSQAKALLLSAQAATPLMGKGGRIIAITYARGGRTGSWQPWVAMGSAKAALESLVRYLAVTLAKGGITVNAISPGWTKNTVLDSLPSAVQDRIEAWHESGWTPMGRLGTPADIGNAVALLCSEDASWITGQTIAVDGGASLMDTCLPLDLQRG